MHVAGHVQRARREGDLAAVAADQALANLGQDNRYAIDVVVTYADRFVDATMTQARGLSTEIFVNAELGT